MYNEIYDNNGNTPLMIAVKKSNKNPTSIYNIKIVEMLIYHGLIINVQDNENNTPMFLAFKDKNYELYNILKEHSAMMYI